MNVTTNHLFRVNDELPLGYLPVPPELQADADKALAGRDEAYIPKHSGGRLGQWAAKQRKAQRRRQMAAKSRRRNRG